MQCVRFNLIFHNEMVYVSNCFQLQIFIVIFLSIIQNSAVWPHQICKVRFKIIHSFAVCYRNAYKILHTDIITGCQSFRKPHNSLSQKNDLYTLGLTSQDKANIISSHVNLISKKNWMENLPSSCSGSITLISLTEYRLLALLKSPQMM